PLSSDYWPIHRLNARLPLGARTFIGLNRSASLPQACVCQFKQRERVTDKVVAINGYLGRLQSRLDLQEGVPCLHTIEAITSNSPPGDNGASRVFCGHKLVAISMAHSATGSRHSSPLCFE